MLSIIFVIILHGSTVGLTLHEDNIDSRLLLAVVQREFDINTDLIISAHVLVYL